MNLQEMKDLIEFARTFHGHICPGLALGMRASQIALQWLGIERASLYDTINEDITAIVKNNNCFADGVQIVTGCTFGNNSLIYHDLGKNAVTVVKGDEGVRVYIDYGRIDDLFDDEAKRLFEKVIVRREGSREDRKILTKKWEEIALAVLELDEGRFDVRSVSCNGREGSHLCRRALLEVRRGCDGDPHRKWRLPLLSREVLRGYR